MFEKYFEMKKESEHNRQMYLWSQKNNQNLSNIHKLYTSIQMNLSLMVDNYDDNKESDILKKKIDLIRIELKKLQERKLPD